SRQSMESQIANLWILEAEEILEAEGHAAAHGACRLHQIKRASVASHHGHIPLREKISQVHENFHVSREEAGRNRLTDEQVQIRIGLARRTIEEVDRRQRAAARVTIGGDPARLRLGQSSAELRCHSMAPLRANPLPCVL